MKNGRFRIIEVCKILNNHELTPKTITVDGIETATGSELEMIVNKFIDDIETIPDSYEDNVSLSVRTLYNALCDGTVEFEDVINKIEQVNVDNTALTVDIHSEPYKRADIDAGNNGDT